jgi:hypothetical protein
MIPLRNIIAPAAFALLLVGCATLQQLAVLRTVTFAFAGVSDVRIAGVRIQDGSTFSSLGVTDAARLGAAVVSNEVPIELIAHVAATNPPENTVAARMVDLDWTLFIEDRKTLDGGLVGAVTIDPGRTADVGLDVRFDLLSLGRAGARDLFDLALAIAGYGALQKELRLEMTPTIETAMGPIRYPGPVVVRRSPR